MMNVIGHCTATRLLFGLISVSLFPYISHAQIPDVYTNINFLTVEHDIPSTFTANINGDFFGYTEMGKYFEQTSVETLGEFRIQKFQIDEAYHYISDIGVIFATNDKAAIQKYLELTQL